MAQDMGQGVESTLDLVTGDNFWKEVTIDLRELQGSRAWSEVVTCISCL